MKSGFLAVVVFGFGMMHLTLAGQALAEIREGEMELLQSAYLQRSGVVVANPSSLKEHFSTVIRILKRQETQSLDIATSRLEALRGARWNNSERAVTRHQLARARQEQLATLASYEQRGRFPINDFHNRATPVFVDRSGTSCAVGYLMLQSGAVDVVREIVEFDNFVYVDDAESGPLIDWIPTSGLTVEEAALIQPSYAPSLPRYPDFVPLTELLVSGAEFEQSNLRYSNLRITAPEGSETPAVDALVWGTGITHYSTNFSTYTPYFTPLFDDRALWKVGSDWRYAVIEGQPQSWINHKATESSPYEFTVVFDVSPAAGDLTLPLSELTFTDAWLGRDPGILWLSIVSDGNRLGDEESATAADHIRIDTTVLTPNGEQLAHLMIDSSAQDATQEQLEPTFVHQSSNFNLPIQGESGWTVINGGGEAIARTFFRSGAVAELSEPTPRLHIVTRVRLDGNVGFNRLLWEFELAPRRMEPEVVFTTPRSGTITVSTLPGRLYNLHRAPAPGSPSSIITTSLPTTDGTLTFSFDDRGAPEPAAYYWIEESQ